MGFTLPTGNEVQLPDPGRVQQVIPMGGTKSRIQAQQQTRQVIGDAIGGALEFTQELVDAKRTNQIDRAQTEYISGIAELEQNLKVNPRSTGLDSEGLKTDEDIAYPNYKYYQEQKKQLVEDIQEKHLNNFFGGSQDFELWRERYDIDVDQRIKSLDIAQTQAERMDVFKESVDTIVGSTTAENKQTQLQNIKQKVFEAANSGLIDNVTADNLLDNAYKDINERALKAQIDEAIAQEDFETAEDIVAEPSNYGYKTYDGRDKFIDEQQRNALRDYVDAEKKQHLRELDKQEEKLANEQYRTLVDDWMANSPEKMQFLIQDSGRYQTYFKRNPREYERWMFRIQSVKDKQAEEAQETQEARAEAKSQMLEKKREWAVKDIETKINAGVDHDEVDRLIKSYGNSGLFDSDLMSEYYGRNESRNPDPVREWLYKQLDESKFNLAEKAQITESIQAELARMNMQGEGANLSMEDAQKIYKNVTEPVADMRVREIINNRTISRVGRRKSIYHPSLGEEDMSEDARTLTARERFTQRLYEDEILYGTANPKVISTVAFEENLGDPEEVRQLMFPNYDQMDKREQRIAENQINAGLVAQNHYQDFAEKWGTDRIENTYITGLGTLVIETDYARFRRITPRGSNDSRWQIKTKSRSGQFSDIWRDYEEFGGTD